MTDDSYSDWPREYPHRGYDQEKLKGYVDLLLAQLAEYERDSDPAGGAATANGKDQKAFEALETAGKLVRAIAGWALDHQYGLALRGLSFVPRYSPEIRERPEYQEQRRAVDDHEHERIGGAAFRTGSIDATVARLLLANLLQANSGGFPPSLQQMAREALMALDYGEVLPLLEPAKEGRKAKYRELRLQIEALGFVEYLRGRGRTKLKAQERVAEAYSVSPSTLNTWEYRLRNELGEFEVFRTLYFARNAAIFTEDAIRAAYKGDPLADHLSFEHRYGDAALRDAASLYKDVMRESRGH